MINPIISVLASLFCTGCHLDDIMYNSCPYAQHNDPYEISKLAVIALEDNNLKQLLCLTEDQNTGLLKINFEDDLSRLHGDLFVDEATTMIDSMDLGRIKIWDENFEVWPHGDRKYIHAYAKNLNYNEFYTLSLMKVENDYFLISILDSPEITDYEDLETLD